MLLSRRADTTLSDVSGARKSRVWKVAVSVVVAVGLLAYVLWRAPLADVGRTILTIKLGWVLASALAGLAYYALRGLRWGLILKPVGTAPTNMLLGCTAAGFASNTVLPARAGEVVRPLLLTARTGLPAAATLASTLTERLADLATILVLFAGGVALAHHQLVPGSWVALRNAAVIAAIGLAVAIAVVLLSLRSRARTISLLVKPFPHRFQERGRHFFGHLLDGLEVVHSPLQTLRLAGWSLTIWLAPVIQLDFLSRAFGLDLGLPAAALVMVVAGLGLAVPTPAGVGGFHAATQFALTNLLGVALPTATAFALVHHVICFLPITVIGLAYLGAIGMSLGRVQKMEEQAEASPDPS